MSDIKKNIIYTAGDIEQYLAGKLSAIQMHAMEKAALDDAFLADAMEGYHAIGDKDWRNQIAALREDITQKGVIAKVIPLHKSKNNWRKVAAAVFILGAGTTLTFILTKNKTSEKNVQEIVQNVTIANDSLSPTSNELPVSVTASLNPTATSGQDEIKMKNVPNASLKNKGDQYVTEPGSAQLNPVTQNGVAPLPVDDKTVAGLPPANTNVSTADNTRLAEETNEARNKAGALKQTQDAEVLNPQRNQGFANLKKEAVLNNFFTAQVVASDNTPLPFTNISIKKENFGTYADAKGVVRLVSTDSILNVEVRSVGYLPKTFTLRNNQLPTKIILQEDEVAVKDRTIIGNSNTAANQRSRRATLITDSAVNVEPADGWDNYNTYVANNLEIPDDILKRDFHGEVEISFDVKSNGTISNIRVNKSLGAGYDEAAKRLIMDGPQWKVKKGRKTSASIKVQF